MNKDDLWVKYRAVVPINKEPVTEEQFRLRDAIIIKYLDLTKRVVASMKKSMPDYVSAEDLESFAKIGLMQAVLRYDNNMGVPFEYFVRQRCHSVIMDGIRKDDWAPRSLRKKQRDIRIAEEKLAARLSREPTISELSKYLNMSEEEIDYVKYKAHISSHTNIEASIEAQNKVAVLDPEDDETVALIRATLAKTVARMPIVPATVLVLKYYLEKNLKTIAEELNMSDVGAIHSEAVLTVWKEFQKALKQEIVDD